MSDYLDSDLEDDNNWILELETVLLVNCDFVKLRAICQDRPVPSHLRNEVWKICLNVNSQLNPLDGFNDVFNLPNQDVLHENCCEFVATLPKDLFVNSIGLISDIEIILTYFSRTYKISYEENNGWLSILRVLCTELKLNKRNDLYNYFAAICHRFMPSSLSVFNGEIFLVFRLLLQYHDPELCSFLDTHRVTPDQYASRWFTSIFSSHIPLDTLVKLWDIYFLVADPFLMFYLSLIIVLNLKDALLPLRGQNKSGILTKIQSAVRSISPNDVQDFHGLAKHYITLTPKSFDLKFSPILFGNANKDHEIQAVLDSLCMPISIHELLESKSRDNSAYPTENIKYFLVDCRPADQYNAGHLSSAYFLDSSLIISSPSNDFQTSVNALLITQQQALEFNSESGGEHICFLGSGNAEEDQIVNMVVAQFLHRMTRYVSMVYGGYRAIHEVLGPQCDYFFTGHDVTKCQVCLLGSTLSSNHQSIYFNQDVNMTVAGSYENQPMEKLLTKFSSAIKLNSSKFKDKIVNYVKNTETEPAIDTTGSQIPKRHYTQNKDVKSAKTYRNTGNIFSIDEADDRDQGLDEHNSFPSTPNEQIVAAPEMINLDLWIKKPEILAVFECRIIDETGALQPGHLLLTTKHLFVLKRSASKFDPINLFLGRSTDPLLSQNMVSIYRRRVLTSVVKITSKKKLPECLTFHYLMNDGCTIELDRYVIDKAGEAARIIKMQIQKMIDEEDAKSS